MDLDASSGEQSPHYKNNAELCALLEDKEIAARAVAFVVNSTRKGIVPLCADVANLMRSKQSLELKLASVRRENDAFRSSLSGGSLPSHSMSPTPPSLSSYTEHCIKSLQDHNLGPFRSSSRCSNSSSTYSYSPKLELGRPGGGAFGFPPRADRARVGSLRPQPVPQSPASSTDSRKHSPRPLRSSLSAFRDSRIMPHVHSGTSPLVDGASRGQGGVTLLVDSKPRDDTDDLAVDIDMTMDIVKDFSNEIFNNIEQLNKRRSLIETSKTDDVQKLGSNASLHIEDETSNVQIKVNDENHTTTQGIKIHKEDEGKCKLSSVSEEKGQSEECQSEKSLLERRRVSLPEITAIPNIRAIRIRPKQSKEVQCSLDRTKGDPSMEEQFMKSVRLNDRLEEELTEARREIEKLHAKIDTLQSGAIPKYGGQTDRDRVADDNGYYTGSNRTSRTGSEHERISTLPKTSPVRQTLTSVTYAGPLPHCRCSECQEALGSDDDLSHYSDIYFEEPYKYAVKYRKRLRMKTEKGSEA
ncbi:hypothetical protein MAR_016455 [Mya arenaria]|uniref:Uncharacterized protein n=1 Tax=Mya arenaria TaxID=6604 RepID=A0ABY7FTD8_MYAAR|nr:hypothetical protein MAR_016455 [Mya arenaria]